MVELHSASFSAECQAGKLCIVIFIFFGLTQLAIEPKLTFSVADALTTRPPNDITLALERKQRQQII